MVGWKSNGADGGEERLKWVVMVVVMAGVLGRQ